MSSVKYERPEEDAEAESTPAPKVAEAGAAYAVDTTSASSRVSNQTLRRLEDEIAERFTVLETRLGQLDTLSHRLRDIENVLRAVILRPIEPGERDRLMEAAWRDRQLSAALLEEEGLG